MWAVSLLMVTFIDRMNERSETPLLAATATPSTRASV